MAAYLPYEPIDPREASTMSLVPGTVESESAAASQAALLLSARAGVLGTEDDHELRQEAEAAGFALPDLSRMQRTRRLRVEEATRPLGVSAKELAQETPPDLRDEMARATGEIYEHPSTETAAALFEAAMHSPHALVRVAAAAGARETTRLRRQIRQTLEEGCLSDDPLVAGVAQEAMSKIDPKHPYLKAALAERTPHVRRTGNSHTAVISHGTWASGSSWYQPGGDFYDGLAAERPDLNLHPRSFTWSGDYSTTAWREGAEDMRDWLSNEGLARPDLFAHSHGATVANRATKLGVTFKRLVLMGWPVRSDWFPDPARVDRIIDVRVRLDLVIMVDGGGQRLRTDQFNVKEHRHGWFNHAATHDPGYWTTHGLWDKV
ncbi:MAG TPA: hypothetical protein VGA97_09960 [Acidimicrobiia bacterium]